MTSRVRTRIDELVGIYTGPEFEECSATERGYHLVRALDTEVAMGLFAPYQPITIDYVCQGHDSITVNVLGYQPEKFTLRIQDSPKCQN